MTQCLGEMKRSHESRFLRKSRLKRDCLEDPVFFRKVGKNVKFSIDVSAACVAFLALPLGGANSTLFSFPFELILHLGGSCKKVFLYPSPGFLR